MVQNPVSIYRFLRKKIGKNLLFFGCPNQNLPLRVVFRSKNEYLALNAAVRRQALPVSRMKGYEQCYSSCRIGVAHLEL